MIYKHIQHDAFCDTVNKVDWSDSYWRIFQNQHDVQNILYNVDLAFVCMMHTTFYILAKSVYTAAIQVFE